jgi:hypothetical protein
MRRLVYNVRHFVVPINFSLLTINLYFSFVTTLVYNGTKYSIPFMTLQPSSTVNLQYGCLKWVGALCVGKKKDFNTAKPDLCMLCTLLWQHVSTKFNLWYSYGDPGGHAV